MNQRHPFDFWYARSCRRLPHSIPAHADSRRGDDPLEWFMRACSPPMRGLYAAQAPTYPPCPPTATIDVETTRSSSTSQGNPSQHLREQMHSVYAVYDCDGGNIIRDVRKLPYINDRYGKQPRSLISAAPPTISHPPAHPRVCPPRRAPAPSTPSAGRTVSRLPRATAARPSRRARPRRSVH